MQPFHSFALRSIQREHTFVREEIQQISDICMSRPIADFSSHNGSIVYGVDGAGHGVAERCSLLPLHFTISYFSVALVTGHSARRRVNVHHPAYVAYNLYYLELQQSQGRR